MLLHRRIYQFFIIYVLAVGFLFLIKYAMGLSDYVIPSPGDIWRTGSREFVRYFSDVLNTMTVAIVGQIISIVLALLVGITGRQATWFGWRASP